MFLINDDQVLHPASQCPIFHRVEQSQQCHTVSWNFYNSYKHISRSHSMMLYNTAWCYMADTFKFFSASLEVLFWLTKSCDDRVGGKMCLLKDFSKHTFICIWSWVLNEGRKLGKDVHTGGVWLWVSRSQLDVPADRTHTWILKKDLPSSLSPL